MTFNALPATTTLILPGWQDSGAGHWQTHWEAKHGAVRVQQHDWHRPLRGDWICQLEEAVLQHAQEKRPLLLAAHSLGCHLVAAWAQVSHHADQVSGALLVAPPDLTQLDLPDPLIPWRKPIRATADTLADVALPFPAIVVASSNDPFDTAKAAFNLSQTWGSGFVSLGAEGHINADSQLEDWDEGWMLLQRLASSTQRDVQSTTTPARTTSTTQ